MGIIDAVTGAMRDTKLMQPAAERLRVSEKTDLQSGKPLQDPPLTRQVTQFQKPYFEKRSFTNFYLHTMYPMGYDMSMLSLCSIRHAAI